MATVLRADAARNLELILEAAHAAFAEKGHEACVADIAARAGVGQATIFRRFETKDELIAAVLQRKLSQVVAEAEAAARKKDAWEGLTSFMAKVTELQVRDRGFFQSQVERFMGDPAIQEQKRRVATIIGELIDRAKAEGTLRDDITASDIPALCCAAVQAGAAGPKAWKRYLQLITDGMRAS